MSVKLYTEVTISEKFKKIIQSGNYEKLVHSLLNLSTKLFPNEIKYIENQSCGECDYIDEKNGEKYDAKLPISKAQGKQHTRHFVLTHSGCSTPYLNTSVGYCLFVFGLRQMPIVR